MNLEASHEIHTNLPPALEVDNVSMAFGTGATRRTVLSGISFSVAPGEFLCIVGASGCGKTTLLRLLAGLSEPSGGQIRFLGRPISGTARERALVFQDYGRALLPWRTVAGNVALALETCGVPQAEQPARIAELVQTMGLTQAIDRYPGQLSGGMQQRVQIARCLAQQPQLLLMDEPFGALDALTRQHLQDEVARLAAARGTSVVFITHDLEEAIYLGDRVILLGAHPGRIVEAVGVELPRPRHQLATREDARFVALRHHLFGLLEGH